MNRYKKGADVERQAINEHIENGAVFSMRGAGSKCRGKLKVDVVALYFNRKDEGFLFLQQYKKSKSSFKKEKDTFLRVKLPKRLIIIRQFIHLKGKTPKIWQKTS